MCANITKILKSHKWDLSFNSVLTFFFLSGMFNKGPLSCKVLAVAMYFFYMSSFFWMMIIAFDVCKTLKMATTQLRLTTGSQWRKFSLYSTVAWGLPVAFVTVVTILDHVEAMPEAFKPGKCLIDLKVR